MSCGDQLSSSYCLFEVFPDLRRWQTVIRKSQPATEDENAGRSTHCVFVLGRNDRHFVSGSTNQRVSYAPGKGNRYPPSKDSSHNRRVGNPPFKVKTSVCLRCVSAWSESYTRQGCTEWRIPNTTLLGHWKADRQLYDLRFHLPSLALFFNRKIIPQAIPRLSMLCSLYVHPKSSCSDPHQAICLGWQSYTQNQL